MFNALSAWNAEVECLPRIHLPLCFISRTKYKLKVNLDLCFQSFFLDWCLLFLVEIYWFCYELLMIKRRKDARKQERENVSHQIIRWEALIQQNQCYQSHNIVLNRDTISQLGLLLVNQCKVAISYLCLLEFSWLLTADDGLYQEVVYWRTTSAGRIWKDTPKLPRAVLSWFCSSES